MLDLHIGLGKHIILSKDPIAFAKVAIEKQLLLNISLSMSWILECHRFRSDIRDRRRSY